MNKREMFVATAKKMYPKAEVLNRVQLMAISKACGCGWSFIYNSYKIGTNQYRLPTDAEINVVATTAKSPKMASVKDNVLAFKPSIEEAEETQATARPTSAITRTISSSGQSMVPVKVKNYVPWGNYEYVERIIASGKYFPTFIAGESGNGKTMMIEQACAKLGRELYRINFTPTTDEGDLIGEKTLVDGNVMFEEGVVITAMRRGAVLLLDELDYATAQGFTAMQSVLEGKAFLNKKTGELIHPKQGFTVFATANTKGKGSNDGRYVGTNFLNEAFLERFSVCLEQEFPPVAVETRILLRAFKAETGDEQSEFAKCLVKWANAIRDGYQLQTVSENISTRRLTHIVGTFAMFGSRLTAVEMCINRFDPETKTSFMDFYKQFDATIQSELDKRTPQVDENGNPPVAQLEDDEYDYYTP